MATLRGRSYRARSVIVATGIKDRLPEMSDMDKAIHCGAVRLCAICDGYEVNGDDVAVYGEAENAINHAVFLRTFTDRVTVIVHGDREACDEALRKAAEYDIKLIADKVRDIRLTDDQRIEVSTVRGDGHAFDIVYPNLGSTCRAALIQSLGAEVDSDGALLVDGHQHTSIEGIYAVGDVVAGLKQISVAIGQAAQAATAVHNRLENNPWRRRDEQSEQGRPAG